MEISELVKEEKPKTAPEQDHKKEIKKPLRKKTSSVAETEVLTKESHEGNSGTGTSTESRSKNSKKTSASSRSKLKSSPQKTTEALDAPVRVTISGSDTSTDKAGEEITVEEVAIPVETVQGKDTVGPKTKSSSGKLQKGKIKRAKKDVKKAEEKVDKFKKKVKKARKKEIKKSKLKILKEKLLKALDTLKRSKKKVKKAKK